MTESTLFCFLWKKITLIPSLLVADYNIFIVLKMCGVDNYIHTLSGKAGTRVLQRNVPLLKPVSMIKYMCLKGIADDEF